MKNEEGLIRSQNTSKEQDHKKPPAGKTKKIRLYPTQSQRHTLNQWFGTVRWTYNQVLDGVMNKGMKRNKKELRAAYVNNDNFSDKSWVLQTPYDVRDEAMNDVLKAYQSNEAKKKKNKPDHEYKIKFRSKKYSVSESIVIHSKHYKKAGVFHPTSFGKNPIRSREKLPDALDYDCRLQRTRLGEFYLCLLLPLNVRRSNEESNSENQAVHHPHQSPCSCGHTHDRNDLHHPRVIAIDPGVRTFLTGYSPTDECIIEWGANDIQRIYRLCAYYDDLQSRITKTTTRHCQRYRMKKAARRIQRRIRNLVDDLHKKSVKWLVESYDLIMLPKFDTQRMVQKEIEAADGSKKKRKINSKTAKAMLTWAHYRFRTRLLNKIREYPNCCVVICHEPYTSQTCSECGHLHKTLGSNKTFKCPVCKIVMDRDHNAARNILLRYLTIVVDTISKNQKNRNGEEEYSF